MVLSPSSLLRMNEDRNNKILNLTLEIIYLLTGEDYTLVKTSGECVAPSGYTEESKRYSRIPIPIRALPSYIVVYEKENEQKILELTNKIIDLLSREEEDYFSEHTSLLKDIKMEDHQPLTLADGSKNPAEGSPRPPDPQDFPQEDDCLAQDNQDEAHCDVKAEVKEELEEKMFPGSDWQYRSIDEDPQEPSPAPHSQDCPEEPEVSQGNEAEVGDLFIIRVDDEEEDSEMFVVNDFPQNEMMTPLPLLTEPERRYACELCIKCFTRKSHLVEHQKTHTGEKPFICSECGDCFTLKGNLERHKRIHRDDRPFQCLDCGKCFFQKSDLVEHQRIHTGEKPYPCVECGKRFIKKSALVKHQKTHSGEKPFSCQECGKRFSQNTGLTEHQKIHRNERPFQCSYCGKSFTQKGGLAEHQRIHTGEKLFSCSDCGKSFTKNSALVIHQRFHTGEKPFMCSVCEKGFTQKSDLVKHLRIHSGERPYSCTVCGKSFTQKPDLVEHVRIHTGEKPFTCLECGKSFTHRSNFVKHQVLHRQ